MFQNIVQKISNQKKYLSNISVQNSKNSQKKMQQSDFRQNDNFQTLSCRKCNEKFKLSIFTVNENFNDIYPFCICPQCRLTEQRFSLCPHCGLSTYNKDFNTNKCVCKICAAKNISCPCGSKLCSNPENEDHKYHKTRSTSLSYSKIEL